MKKILVLIAVLIVVGGVIVFSDGRSPKESTGEPIKIGASVALSGPLAFIGAAEQNGLLLAIEEINRDGGVQGRPLELVAEDNEGAAEKAVSGVQKMLAVDNIDILFVAFTHITQAVETIAATAGLPVIYAASLPDVAVNNELFFRDYFDAENMGSVLGDYIIEQDVQRLAYIGEKNDACEPYFEEVERIVQEDGNVSLVLTERFLPDVTDLRTSLLKAKELNADGIFTCTWRKSDIFMRQLKELGMMDVKVFQTVAPFLPSADTPEMRALYEENQTVSTWFGFVSGSLSRNQKKFFDTYVDRFGVDPISDAAFAYDDVYVLADVIEQCLGADGDLDTQCFSQTMVNVKYDGVAGKLSFNEQGLSQRDGLLIKVVDGEWVEVE